MSYTSNASHLIIKYKNLFNILCGATVQKTQSTIGLNLCGIQRLLSCMRSR